LPRIHPAHATVCVPASPAPPSWPLARPETLAWRAGPSLPHAGRSQRHTASCSCPGVTLICGLADERDPGAGGAGSRAGPRFPLFNSLGHL
ncbi:hypothetical protein AAFF_G00184760, partial [Aldrovandia affinis]